MRLIKTVSCLIVSLQKKNYLQIIAVLANSNKLERNLKVL